MAGGGGRRAGIVEALKYAFWGERISDSEEHATFQLFTCTGHVTKFNDMVLASPSDNFYYYSSMC